MGWLERILGGNDSQSFTIEAVTPTCQFESNNNDCSLIQQLKEKQAKKKEIDARIKSFDEHNPVNLKTFVELLVRMENNSFSMGRSSGWYDVRYGNSRDGIAREFSTFHGVGRFERVIDMTTAEDIDKIYEELKAIKHRNSNLSKLRSESHDIGQEIQAIKAQLGIE